MQKEKQAALAAIEAKREMITDVADRIWEFAELSLMEQRSARLYCELLNGESVRLRLLFRQALGAAGQ